MTYPQPIQGHGRAVQSPQDALFGAVESHLDAMESQIRWLRRQAQDARECLEQLVVSAPMQPEETAGNSAQSLTIQSEAVDGTDSESEAAQRSPEPASVSSEPEWREKARRAREERARFLEELRTSREAAARNADAQPERDDCNEPDQAQPENTVSDSQPEPDAEDTDMSLSECATGPEPFDEPEREPAQDLAPGACTGLTVQDSPASTVIALPASGLEWVASWYATARSVRLEIPSVDARSQSLPEQANPELETGAHREAEQAACRFRRLPLEAGGSVDGDPLAGSGSAFQSPAPGSPRVFRRVS